MDDKRKNIIVTNMYRPPAGNFKQFKKLLKHHLASTCNKNLYITGDFNTDLLSETELDGTHFLNTLFQYNILPLINKPTRITRSSETLIDNILTNNFKDHKVKSGIIKTDISDHFLIFMTENKLVVKEGELNTKHVRQINEKSISKFRSMLEQNTEWELIKDCKTADSAYDLFIRFFYTQHDKAFPKIEKVCKQKSSQSQWMTKGLIKSSRRKQRLYEKFLKRKTLENEQKYKEYKNLFESLKKKSKRNHYSTLLNKNLGNAKKTWDIIKEVTGKAKITNMNGLPKKDCN